MKSINRKEAFMAAMAGEGEAPKPLTREEELAGKIADRIGQGGSSGLPDVTADDNGYFLRVLNGVWAKSGYNPPSQVLYATFTYNELDTQWECDVSAGDVIKWIINGNIVFAKALIAAGQYAVLPVTGLMYLNDDITGVAFSAVGAASATDVKEVTSAYIGYSALGISCNIEIGYLSAADPNI